MEEMFEEQEEVKTTKVEGVLINWSSVLAFFISAFGAAYFLINTIYASIAYAELSEYSKTEASPILATSIMHSLGVMLFAFFIVYIIIHMDKKIKLKRAELRLKKNQTLATQIIADKMQNDKNETKKK